MTLTRDSSLFFDATCLIAAAGSPTGGSGFLLSVCQAGFLNAFCSPSVLVEAERNITAKLHTSALATYHLQLAATPIILISTPQRRIIQQYDDPFGKDAHVVASAMAASFFPRRARTRARLAFRGASLGAARTSASACSFAFEKAA